MKVPKYISELLYGAKFVYDLNDYVCRGEGEVCNKDKLSAGYTIAIRKYNTCGACEPFRKEIERFAAWVNRQNGGECHILYTPSVASRKHTQYAIVTVYDPVMQGVEQFFCQK